MQDGGRLILSADAEVVNADVPAPIELQPGRYVRLSVTDTGCGMDEQTMARALEPFFSTKPPGQGTGLGLSMAKGFAEQSGGGLFIDSAPGRGTTVHLWLPSTTRIETLSFPPKPAAPQRLDHGKRMRILFVDDEVAVRETMAASLEDTGFDVLLAANGTEALALLAAETAIDVLVTDLSMPDMNGLTLMRNARRHRPDLPAVLLTGYTGHGAQLAVGSSLNGTFTLVRKPVTAAQLADRVEALLAVSLSG
jgi:CheY-like chemotaxis protein